MVNVGEREQVGEKLPKGWKWVRLADICEDIYRYPSFYGIQHLPSGIPVIRGEHIGKNGEISTSWETFWFVSNEVSEKFPRTILKKDDLVFTVRGTIGKVGIIRNIHIGSQISPNLIRISPLKTVNSVYLWYYLQSIKGGKNRVEDNAVTIATVKASDIVTLPVPLPPLPEQKRIVDILTDRLSTIDKSRTATEAQLKAAKALPTAYLREVFDSPEAQKWEKKRLGDIAETCSGSTPSRERKDYYIGEIPWIKTGELRDDIIYHSEEHISTLALRETSVKLLPAKTLLVAMYGQGQTRGRTGLLAQPATTNQACFAILPNDEEFEPKYLQFWFQNSYSRLREETEGRGGNQPNLNGELLRDQIVVLPPLDAQLSIVSNLERVNEKTQTIVKSLQSQLDTINKLPAALLRQAFNGEL